MNPSTPAAAPHVHDLTPFRHSHRFADAGGAARAGALLTVTWITLVTMVIELVAGAWSGSLALTADGWHMGTHAAALGGAVLAYRLSQRAHDRAGYAFGGWKIEVLAGYSSGLLLLAVAVMLVVESVTTLITPHAIDYREALVVAVLGLAVNLASAWLMSRGAKAGAHDGAEHDHAAHDGPAHGHGHVHAHATVHAHGHAHGAHHDHNFRAAYLHVLADALTSLLAIAALAGGLWFGWHWLDPVVALVGAGVIAVWSSGLLRASACALVDATADDTLRAAVKTAIESDGDATLADLHVWQVGPQAYSVVLAVVADVPLAAQTYRERLAGLQMLRHITVEVNRCTGAAHHQAAHVARAAHAEHDHQHNHNHNHDHPPHHAP